MAVTQYIPAEDPRAPLTESEIRVMLQNIDKLTDAEVNQIHEELEELERRKRVQRIQDDLIEFCKHMQGDFIVGKHHRKLADMLMACERGEKDRICVNMPPRHGKTQITSIYAPAWFIGKNPTKKIMLVSHTADLAVDFGRKVRNLINSEAYREIFPHVQLSSDSKSAGRWNTSAGGEFYACISPETEVMTTRGITPAKLVNVGDLVKTSSGYRTVLERFESSHQATHWINGTAFSAEHPIWVFGRGWIPAKDVQCGELLWVASFFDKVGQFFRGLTRGPLEHTDVPSLVQHEVPLRKSQKREVSLVRRARYLCRFALAGIRELFAGYGEPAVTSAHFGSYRCGWSVQSAKLPMGHSRRAVEQQAVKYKNKSRWGDPDSLSMVKTTWAFSGGSEAANFERHVAGRSGDPTAYEDGQPINSCSPDSAWHWRSAVSRIFISSRRRVWGGKKDRTKVNTSSAYKAAQKLQGVLLGVCRVHEVKVEHHEPKPFINFHIDTINNFYADGILTHNCGVGSALAGRGAHFLIIDDPHNEQDILNGNLEIFEKAYDWFRFGARTRLMPNSSVSVVHCMTGDTPVMRPNGSETPLKDIRPGDMVASYKDGEVVSRKVLNWANQGSDHIYTIKMFNGNLIRGNERHPFLVNRGGVLTWVKVRDLKAGDSLVSITAEGRGKLKQNQVFVTDALNSKLENEKTQTTPQKACEVPPTYLCQKGDLFALLRDANDPQEQKHVPADATPVLTESATIENTPMLLISGLVTTASGRAKRVLKKVAINLLPPKDSVTPTQAKPTTGKERQKANTTAQIRGGITTLKCVTGLTKNSTTRWLRNRKDDVQYAVVCLKSATIPSLGFTTSSPLTTAIPPGRFEDFYATTAISSSKTAQLKIPYSTQFSTCEIISITPDGVEEVFDIQVEDTENFIANGFVSHNTRWSREDMTGRLVRDMAKDPKADQYEVVEFPAILDVKRGEDWVEVPLWPEFFDLDALHRTKASMPTFQWNAQYQQNPTSEEAAIVKREWWRKWHQEEPPECEYLIMSLDAAAEKHNRADYTALTTWGVFHNEDEEAYNLILLNSIKDRFEFPELKTLCMDNYREWQPDAFIVEKKSSGVAIYQEMRRMGLPVSEFTPHRGTGDKIARLNSVSDIVSSGMCWVPDTRWAEELVDEMAAFPFGSNDDLVDSTVMALMRFRSGGFIRLPSDEPEEVSYFKRRKGKGYY